MATPHDDGNAITCKACNGKGRSNGITQMRNPFLLSAWDGHCNCKMHIVAVANIEAEKEAKHLNKKKQKPMGNFFATIKKKDKNEEEEEEVVPVSSRVDVDLTVRKA